jgi:transcriptional regulator with XRE-family HTH domain
LPFCHHRLTITIPPLSKAELIQKGYPDNPTTIGQHIKKRRLDLGLRQEDLAGSMGVRPPVCERWEQKNRLPSKKVWPKIIEFLGYDPRPVPVKFSDRLVWFRESKGLRQSDLSKLIKINPVRIGRWERGIETPPIALIARLEKLGFSVPQS